MNGEFPSDYLSGLPDPQRAALAQVNKPGREALDEYLGSGEAVAFLGAGTSAPLYPLWTGLIAALVDAAADKLGEEEAATLRALAAQNPEEAVEIVRRRLGSPADYQAALRRALRVRTDPESGRTWTPVQELVCRCNFKGLVTTNYDPGIVDARMRVRPHASGTGFTTWDDEIALDRWRTGEAFGEIELPVLYAHGQHNRLDGVVLATTEYRRAYEGKLSRVLGRLVDAGHLAWIGFSFADQRIAAILREVAQESGTRLEPGAESRHVAIMPWDPAAEGNDPGILAARAEIAFGAKVVLYPVPGGDHSALATLLAGLVDPRYPPAPDLPATPSPVTMATGSACTAEEAALPAKWVPSTEPVEHFTGRVEELMRLDRFAADPEVSLVGVTAWGGAGKTALVTHWVQEASGPQRRPDLHGVFVWSFYADASAEHWANVMLEWAADQFGIRIRAGVRPAARVLALLEALPLLLVLDGLEVAQEGLADDGFGRLLDGTLREVLTGACRTSHAGLVVLTSRFPFADLEAFDGTRARMLEVPPFTPAEGADLLAAAGGGWMAEAERRELVQAVDGHALAVGVLAGVLSDRPSSGDLQSLRGELSPATHTDARVQKVLRFYADRLSEQDRYLVAAISLFARPVAPEALLTVAEQDAFGGHLDAWTPATVEAAVRDRLTGLVSLHLDGTLSAHPLVRDTFRPLVMGAAEAAADITLTGLPEGEVRDRADALRLVEAIELLLDAGHWEAADSLYRARAGNGQAWMRLPAARLGQRVANAFVATQARRDRCVAQLGPDRLGYFINEAGLFATHAGDLVTARDYLLAAVRCYTETGDAVNCSRVLQNLTGCLGRLGEIDQARQTATEALKLAVSADDRDEISDARSYLGWLAELAGETVSADEHFTAGDITKYARGPDDDHLDELVGVWWGEFLTRTGRDRSARLLNESNRTTCALTGWKPGIILCDRLLGRLALASGNIAIADARLTEAVASFREGDLLVDLAATLVDLSNCERAAGKLDAAEGHVAEALSIASPRGLIPTQSAALAARARIFADRTAATGDMGHLARGRDAADAVLRLATRGHHLPWCELDALRAHARLDEVEGAGQGWAARAKALHKRLVPPGLDPDPLATVERLVAEENAAKADQDDQAE
jgi:tetratricopeptide (TPR) repeat protein